MTTAANEPRFLCRLAGNEMLVVEFTAEEGVSQLFKVTLELVSEEEVNFEDVVGQTALITLEGLSEERYFHGIVSMFAQTGTRGRFFQYQATVVPSAWVLGLEQDCRIFQDKSVPQIVQQILEESGITGEFFDFRLQGNYPNREYCVQYRQTDLDFISRLLEEEGIFYFYEHNDQKHVMVFGDGTVNYQPIRGEAQVVFNAGGAMVAEEEAVTGFNFSKHLRSGKYTLRDFNFLKPSLDLTSDNSDNENTSMEMYDYPGKYADGSEGRRRAQSRMEEAMMFKDLGQGKSVCPRLTAGFTFSLSGHGIDGFNREYLLVKVRHTGSQPQVLGERSKTGEGTRYLNTFNCVPSSVTVRPELKTAKPVVEGVQTAIVVGPSGEEIYTDKHGRVKVQFHWDRLGQKDENSSCWIRVSQVWAGAGWGAMFIPRIGHEVLVDFIEGDPDRPIITGRVYHGANTPPYTLPDDKTKSVIKSNSSTGGGGSNELRFEDKKDSEEIYLHGQKDWTIAIDNDKTQNVGHDEKLTVGNDREKTVNSNQTETIGSDKKISVGSNHDENISSNQTIVVGAKRDVTVGSDEKLTVGANRTVTVGASQTQNIAADTTVNCTAEKRNVGGQRNITVGGMEDKNIGGMRKITAAVENYTVAGLRTITVGNETKTITNQQKFLGMDVTTDSGAKFENFAGMKVSNAFALLMELKQISISVTNAAIGYTSFKLDQDGIQVKTNALLVIG